MKMSLRSFFSKLHCENFSIAVFRIFAITQNILLKKVKKTFLVQNPILVWIIKDTTTQKIMFIIAVKIRLQRSVYKLRILKH